MRGEQLDLEGLARELRRLAHLADQDLVLSPTIAERVLGVPVRLARTRTGNVLVRSHGVFPWEGANVVGATATELRRVGLVKAKLRGGIDQGRVAIRMT